MKQIRILLISVVFHFSLEVLAQQAPQFTQYMLNAVSFNPAYARSKEYSEITFSARSQWVGLPGAPRTQLLTISSPLKNSNWGLSSNIMNDTAGPIKEVTFNAGAAYEVQLSATESLTLGLRFGGRFISLDNNLGFIKDGGDGNLHNYKREIRPEMGLGLLYKRQNFFVGIAAPNIIPMKNHDKTRPTFGASNRIHFFVNSGMMLYINDSVLFEPVAMTKVVVGAPMTVDVSANFLFYRKFRFGVNYRLGNAMGALIGLKIGSSSELGYSYDLTTGEYRQYNSGTHEVILKLGFGKYKSRRKVVFF